MMGEDDARYNEEYNTSNHTEGCWIKNIRVLQKALSKWRKFNSTMYFQTFTLSSSSEILPFYPSTPSLNHQKPSPTPPTRPYSSSPNNSPPPPSTSSTPPRPPPLPPQSS